MGPSSVWANDHLCGIENIWGSIYSWEYPAETTKNINRIDLKLLSKSAKILGLLHARSVRIAVSNDIKH